MSLKSSLLRSSDLLIDLGITTNLKEFLKFLQSFDHEADMMFIHYHVLSSPFNSNEVQERLEEGDLSGRRVAPEVYEKGHDELGWILD